MKYVHFPGFGFIALPSAVTKEIFLMKKYKLWCHFLLKEAGVGCTRPHPSDQCFCHSWFHAPVGRGRIWGWRLFGYIFPPEKPLIGRRNGRIASPEMSVVPRLTFLVFNVSIIEVASKDLTFRWLRVSAFFFSLSAFRVTFDRFKFGYVSLNVSDYIMNC